jgi:hypothetical protein
VPLFPKQDIFDIKEISCLHLNKYQLATCLKFILVNLWKDNTISLKWYLGIYFEDLQYISKHLDTTLSEKQSVNHQANWKIIVENVL